MRGLAGSFAEFDSEDLEPGSNDALAHRGKFLKPRRWSRRPTEHKQHRSSCEHAAQRALDAIGLESELGNGVTNGGDLSTELAHQDARGAGADEADHVPALTRGKCGGKARHSPIGAAPADPPEQIGGAVGEQVPFGQIGWPNRRPAAAGPSPRPLKPWHETQFSL